MFIQRQPEMPDKAGDQKSYWAFISYSSKDRKWGEWLHRRLENYPIPPEFRGLEVFDGAVLGKNLRPVFRDRDELAGSANLGEAIHTALEASRFLVVLCSKNAAKSKWVNKEIEDFQALGKGGRILALILDGEPNATAQGLTDEECFPPALRYPAEPIAGDLRKEGDGKERGFLKVLAGIAQLDFDKLYRRHERAQARKQLLAGVTTFLVISLFAGLSFFAYHQQLMTKVKQLEMRIQSAQSDFLTACQMSDQEGYANTALPYLARAIETNPGHVSARYLLLVLLTQRKWPMLVKHFMSEDNESKGKQPIADFLSSYSFLGDDPTHRYVATTPTTNTCRVTVWDMETRLPTGMTLMHESAVDTVRFSPKSKWLAVMTDSRAVSIWDFRSGTRISKIIPDLSTAFDISISHNESKLLLHSASAFHLWNIETGAPCGKPLEHGMPATGKFSPDDSMIVTSALYDNAVCVWNTDTGERIARSQQFKEKIGYVDFFPDSSRIAIGLENGTIAVIDSKSGYPVCERIVAKQTHSFRQPFRLAVDSVATLSNDKMSSIWHIPSTNRLADQLPAPLFLMHNATVNSAFFDSDGQRIITACGNTVQIWDAHSGNSSGPLMRHDAVVNSATFSPDCRKVVSTSNDRTAKIWDRSSGELIGRPLIHPESVLSAQFHPREPFLLTISKHAVFLWNTQSCELKFTIPLTNRQPSFISFTPDGSRLLVALDDNTLNLWELSTGCPLGKYISHSDAISSISFSPDGKRVATASVDKTVCVWDFETGRLMNRNLYDGMVTAIAFSPDGNLLAVASGGAIRICDAQTLRILGAPIWTTGVLSKFIQYSPDGKRLLVDRFHSVAICSVTSVSEAINMQLSDVRHLAEAFSGCHLNASTGCIEFLTPSEIMHRIAELQMRSTNTLPVTIAGWKALALKPNDTAAQTEFDRAKKILNP
jgi:WD40 repeat protein